MEASSPTDAFVLGVDEHTALVLDLDAGTATVAGLARRDGARRRPQHACSAAGAALSIDALGEAARALAAGDAAEAVHDAALAGSPAETRDDGRRRPCATRWPTSRARSSPRSSTATTREAVAALLDLDSAIAARLRQGEDSPDLDSASAMFRSLIVRLGDGAAAGAETHVIDGELVGGLVEARDTARANRDFATADRIRDRLAAAGIEVR